MKSSKITLKIIGQPVVFKKSQTFTYNLISLFGVLRQIDSTKYQSQFLVTIDGVDPSSLVLFLIVTMLIASVATDRLW